MMGKIESKAMFLLWHCARAGCASLFLPRNYHKIAVSSATRLWNFLFLKKAKEEFVLLILHVKLADNTQSCKEHVRRGRRGRRGRRSGKPTNTHAQCRYTQAGQNSSRRAPAHCLWQPPATSHQPPATSHQPPAASRMKVVSMQCLVS